MAIRAPEFYKEFAMRHEITQKDAKKYVEGVFSLIEEHLASGDTVDLISFAKFEIKERAPKVGRNPHTGERIDIPACKILKVTAKKSFLEKL